MNRSYYSNSIKKFLQDDEDKIFGKLAAQHQFALEDLQKYSWIRQIGILKKNLSKLTSGNILFEYAIPRMGKRVDTILIFNGYIFVLEFKVGANDHSRYATDQVLDYALDLKNFHEQSCNLPIVPIVIATGASKIENIFEPYEDLIYKPIKANKEDIGQIIDRVAKNNSSIQIDAHIWEYSNYRPTPTIVEAAQALYRGHNVREISRSDAGAMNLSLTSDAISRIIDEAKINKHKVICFVTGVPGAGKTLAGLNIANNRLRVNKDEHAVFLSGNGPLVEVLREALARDEVASTTYQYNRITKKKAQSKARSFIQNIHHFRDDALSVESPPIEKVVVFDEAQRAWTLEQTSTFMQRKKGLQDFSMSEPEFLISTMDRHKDWAVIICLVGGGQEINTGEAGLPEWFVAIKKRFSHWRVFTSSNLSDYEYSRGMDLFELIGNEQLTIEENLHLAVSVRSFRSEKVSELIKTLLDSNHQRAIELYKEISLNYPIAITRDFEKAKSWLKRKARGTERYGLITSSGSYRLKPFGINIQAKVDVINWFLNGKDDVRSSFFLEDVATEFDIQGLELDWTCVAWDANFRYSSRGWEYKSFRGTIWQNINDEIRKLYLKNAYRVLLTRARQGMIIFLPFGNDEDETRQSFYYDETFNYLKTIGFECL